MKEIDFQLTAQDVRYPVYEYMELDGGEWAKFEQFSAGKTNFQGLQDQFKDPVVYEEIVRRRNGIILNRIIFRNSKLY